MMNFHPIQDQRLSDRIAQQFTQAMQSGELTVGTRLPPEAQLADQLGVSRGILREALTILEARGYLSRTPRAARSSSRWWAIPSPAPFPKSCAMPPTVTCWNFARSWNAAPCKTSSAPPATNRSMRSTACLTNRRRKRNPLPSWTRYFHFQLAKLSGNRLFSCFIDTYYELIREIKTRSMRTESRRAAVMREHRAILDALRARDVEAAQERVRRHLDAVRFSLEKSER